MAQAEPTTCPHNHAKQVIRTDVPIPCVMCAAPLQASPNAGSGPVQVANRAAAVNALRPGTDVTTTTAKAWLGKK